MTRRTGVLRAGMVALLALMAWLAPAAVAGAQDSGLSPGNTTDGWPPYGVDHIAEGGFGDDRNSYSWSMAWFKGKLYVGTARQQACFENLTIDFYLPVLEQYKNGAFPGVTCPPDPWDMDLRAEIWQYTPQTRTWKRVFRAPTVPNPDERGKRVGRDIAFRGMGIYRDAKGRQALYALGVTADEVLPELRRKYPPRLMMSTDGVHWTGVPARGALIRNPFGTARVIGFRSVKVLHGRMYVTLTGGLTGDGEVYEVTRPWDPQRARFRQITPSNLMVFEIETYKGALYAGTGSRDAGYGVYKTMSRRAPYTWTPVIPEGAGRGSRITSVVSMHRYRGELYVGSSGWYNDDIPQSELIRIDRAGRWDVVVGNPREVGGELKAPISGIGDGFNSIFQAHFWRMGSQDGALYLGTNDWSWMLQLSADYPTVYPLLLWEFGFDVWRSCDGANWEPVTRTAFNANMANFGARNLIPTPLGLFVGSANHAQGTSVWLDRQLPCAGAAASGAGTAKAAPAAPARVFAAAQQDANVVSWTHVAGARSYEVQRAQDVPVAFSFRTPPAGAHGLHADTDVPQVVAPGAPDSTAFRGATMGDFKTIGTTTGAGFVDRTRRPGARYAYRVVADGAAGASAGSTVQVVPDLRPAVSWADVQRAATRAAGRQGATSGLRSAAAGLRARSFKDASAAGRAQQAAVLGHVERAAPSSSRLADLAWRLGEQLRLHDAAGGPA